MEQVIQRAKESGAECLLVPGINMESVDTISEVCRRYPRYCHGMIGLHPADVKADYIGFEVENLFVIGYGLDYDQKYRNLPYISYLEG